MRDKESLLIMALDSLKTDASSEKRHSIFSTNQQTILDITQVTSTTVGNLQIKPSINGEVETQRAQPIKHSQTFEIDLSKITLPSQCGQGSLRDAIQRLCSENRIQTDAKINTATFTSVITALAGQHTESDKDCSDVCKAEFVPVLKPTNSETRAIVLCYSLNGETKLRVDHLKVSGSMTCLGRQSGSSTALQAIEIPNLLAAEMQEDQPALFQQLQKSACIVAVVEYDLVQPQTNYYESLFNVRGGAMRGGSDGYRGGNSQGVSAYSVIGQGSQTQDRSISIAESGERKLKKIQVYVVGAMVVNTNLQKPGAAQCAIIVQLMQARANELNELYLPYKTYSYENFMAEMNSYMEHYSVNTRTDIIEHSLLALGSIEDNPTTCKIGPSQKTPQYFFIDYGLSFDAVKKLVSNLQDTFGRDFCQYTPEFNQGDGLQAVRFSLEQVAKNISLIKQKIDGILLDPRALMAYQNYARQEEILFTALNRNITELVTPVGLSLYHSDCMERIFLKIFGCDDECRIARYQPGTSYVGKMLDTHFFLDISETAARQVVERINQKFPGTLNHARFVRSDARITDKGSVDLREIAVSTSVLNNSEFLALFKTTLSALIEDQPLFIEQLKIQSGTQRQSSKHYSETLTKMASLYKSAESEPKLKLGDALSQFSLAISDQTVKKSRRLEASDNLRRAISFFESTQTASENKQFKQEDKKAIKEAQKTLGLYN